MTGYTKLCKHWSPTPCEMLHYVCELVEGGRHKSGQKGTGGGDTIEDFLQRLAKARGDIPSQWGTSLNSTGDVCLSNDLHLISWITIDCNESQHPDHKQTSWFSCPNSDQIPRHFPMIWKICVCSSFQKKTWTFLSSKSLKSSRFCFIEASSWILILLERLSHMYIAQLLPREHLTGGELLPHDRWQEHSPRKKGSAGNMWLDWFLKCLKKMPKNQVVFILLG